MKNYFIWALGLLIFTSVCLADPAKDTQSNDKRTNAKRTPASLFSPPSEAMPGASIEIGSEVIPYGSGVNSGYYISNWSRLIDTKNGYICYAFQGSTASPVCFKQ